MDLLSKVYGGTSDEDDKHDDATVQLQGPIFPPAKRAKFHYLPTYRPNPSPNPPAQASLPGRYISKRERAAAAMASASNVPNSTTTPSSTTLPGKSHSGLKHSLLKAASFSRLELETFG